MASILNFGLVTWAEFAGTSLLDQLRAAAAASGGTVPDTVRQHASHGEALAVISFVLMAIVILSGWRWLPPGAATPRGRRAITLLAAGAIGLGVVSVSTLMLGLESVWAQNPLY